MFEAFASRVFLTCRVQWLRRTLQERSEVDRPPGVSTEQAAAHRWDAGVEHESKRRGSGEKVQAKQDTRHQPLMLGRS